MPTTIVEHIDVDLRPRSAFPYVADLSNLASWDPTFRSSRALDGSHLAIGKQFLVTTAAGSEILYEIVEYVPNQHVAFEGTSEHFTTRDEIDFELTLSGSHITWRASVDTAMPNVLETLATPLFKVVGAMAGRGLAKTMHEQLLRSA